jgi:hypothetical protein
MALSGTVNTTDYQGRYVSLTWTGTQDTSKNQTTISWTLKGAGEASSSWYNSGPFYVNVGGTEKESSSRIKLYNGTEIMTGSKTITHDSKGEASVKITVKAAIYAADYNKSGEKTFTLNTIPRKATITKAPNFDDEDSPTVEYSNPAGGTLNIGIYKTDGSTAIVGYRACSGSSYKFNFTAAERTALQNACKTANSMSVRIYLRTTISGANYYHYVTKTLSIVNANPVIAPTAFEEQDDNGIKNTAATGSNMRWVKDYSDIQYAFNPTFKKGATLKSCSVACGQPFKDNSLSGVLYNVNGDSVLFSLTDSRDNTAFATVDGTLVEYIKPTCILSTSAILDTETTAKVSLNITGSFFNGQVKAGEDNSLTVQYRYKSGSGSYGSWVSVPATKSCNKYTVNYDVGNLPYKEAYTFQARVIDSFYSAHSSAINSGEVGISAMPIFDWSKDDFNFNVPVSFSGDEWHDLTYTSNFKNYNDNAINQAKYKVCGNMVFVCGVATPWSDFSSTTSSVVFATGIPAKYCPHIAQHTVCQGSGMNRWLLSVGTNGDLNIARYGTTTSGTTCPAGAWLPFSFTYMI